MRGIWEQHHWCLEVRLRLDLTLCMRKSDMTIMFNTHFKHMFRYISRRKTFPMSTHSLMSGSWVCL